MPKKAKEFPTRLITKKIDFYFTKWVTHPIVVENGDLFSSADNFGFVDALVVVDVLQDCVAVPLTTFWAALLRRPVLSACRCPNLTDFIYRCQYESRVKNVLNFFFFYSLFLTYLFCLLFMYYLIFSL